MVAAPGKRRSRWNPIDWVGGYFAGQPAELATALSPGARELIEEAFAGIDPDRLVDLHIHPFGQEPDPAGPSVSPSVWSWRHPYRMVQFRVYLSAAGIRGTSRITGQMVERLLALVRHFGAPGRFFLYAMDRHYRPDGTLDPTATTFFVPNDYVVALAQRHPDRFVPVVSIHPYRPDALAELERWARQGVRYLKWLPQAQGIDPTSPRTEPFYRLLRETGTVLLAHTGAELAVFTGRHQELGNPLLLRAPLDQGVRVVALHSASFGRNIDRENPGRPTVSSFALFLRLMDEPRYTDLLYGEIAGVTSFNHSRQVLATLLERTDLHPRLINGSDYPLPAINFLVMTGRLAALGFITWEERRQLNEIYRSNPLLFDFVLKRTIRHPASGRRFAASVFTLPPALPLPG